MNRLLLFLIFSSFLFSQINLPSLSERMKKGPIPHTHYENAVENSEFPFDQYGVEISNLVLEAANLDDNNLASFVNRYPSEKNDLLVKEHEETWMKAYSSLKMLKTKIDSFDMVYDKSFEFTTSSGLVYDDLLLKRIYKNMYYEVFYSFGLSYERFQSNVYDYNKNIDLSSSFTIINEFFYNEYLEAKEDEILKNEVTVGGFFGERTNVEDYFLEVLMTGNLMNLSFDVSGWYNNPELQRLYASEYIKILISILESREVLDLTWTGKVNVIERKLERLWNDRYLDNKKFKRTSRFKVFNPKDLTKEDYYNIARLHFVVKTANFLNYMNGTAALFYGEKGDVSDFSFFISYEEYFSATRALLLIYDYTVREGEAFSKDSNFQRINRFLPNVLEQEYKFGESEHSNVNDIGIFLLSSSIFEYIKYAQVLKDNGYMEEYSEIVDMCVEFLETSLSTIKIDSDSNYNKEVINLYVKTYVRVVEEEIIRNMTYGLYNDMYSSDLLDLGRNKLQYTVDLSDRFSVSEEIKETALYNQKMFELRVGLQSDVIINNKLTNFDPIKDFKYYEDFFETMKNTKDDDPDWYYGYFGSLIAREGFSLIEKILSEDEIIEIYNFHMDKAFEVPSESNLFLAARLDDRLFGPTLLSLGFLDHGFSILSERSKVGDIQEFPERFATLGYFWKQYNIMNYFLNNRGIYDDGVEEEINQLVKSGSYRSKEEHSVVEAITSDNTLKSLIHSENKDYTILEYLQWNYMESYKDTTNFNLQNFLLPIPPYDEYWRNAGIFYPDSLLIVSYNFSKGSGFSKPDYLINTIGLYAPDSNKTEEDRTKLNTVLSTQPYIYKFVDAIDLNKAIMKNNLMDSSLNENNDLIFDTLIKPIEDQLKNYKNIVIISDPFLDNFPIESLKDRDGNFLIEKYNFSYANSFDQLFNDFGRKRYPNTEISSTIFGNVNYNSHPSFNTLEWSDDEIEYIHKNSIFKSTLYENQHATETNFKNLLNSLKGPSRIHLSLHAYNDSFNYRNSSIIFNQDEENDGRLTYEEAEKLDYSNINLIVLSACETNEGKTINNFSHLTFQHLFKMNGASNVISTLWRIDDKATFYFMKELYDSINLYFYNTPMAVSNAKRSFIAKYPEYNHPYYWAGFSSYGF